MSEFSRSEARKLPQNESHSRSLQRKDFKAIFGNLTFFFANFCSFNLYSSCLTFVFASRRNFAMSFFLVKSSVYSKVCAISSSILSALMATLIFWSYNTSCSIRLPRLHGSCNVSIISFAVFTALVQCHREAALTLTNRFKCSAMLLQSWSWHQYLNTTSYNNLRRFIPKLSSRYNRGAKPEKPKTKWPVTNKVAGLINNLVGFGFA